MSGPGLPLPAVRLFHADRPDDCPACGADWKAIDVSHGPGCPKHLVEEDFNTLNGILVRRRFRLVNAKLMGLAITLSDITQEELRIMELIEPEKQEQAAAEDHNTKRGVADPEAVATVIDSATRFGLNQRVGTTRTAPGWSAGWARLGYLLSDWHVRISQTSP